MNIKNGQELIEKCKDKNINIYEFAINEEITESRLSRKEVYKKMENNLKVMQSSGLAGINKKVFSVSGLIGGDAKKMYEYSKGKTLSGNIMTKAMAYALSTSEFNASMGKIVAAPTAGASGILPAVFLIMEKEHGLSKEKLVKGLFTASTIGAIIAQNATISGAEGGCQAECGSASAMAAGAIVEMMGGSPEEALNAGAIVFKNILGLVCDPVAGLVEIPCAKRNASGAVNALTAADMSLAGISSKIPFDETVSAMYKIGKSLPESLRETGLGGLAGTKTGKKLEKKVFKN